MATTGANMTSQDAPVDFTFSELSKKRRVSVSTIWRWTFKGIILPDGRRAKLKATKLGGIWRCKESDFNFFVESITAAALASIAADAAALPRTLAERENAVEGAESELLAAGW
jgi:hypothetical protein